MYDGAKKSLQFETSMAAMAAVNFGQSLVLIHCPHSSGGYWLPDNGFVGIRGLSLERLCTLFHES